MGKDALISLVGVALVIIGIFNNSNEQIRITVSILLVIIGVITAILGIINGDFK